MNDTPDLSKALEQLQDMLSGDDGQNQIQGILDMLTSSSNNNASSEDSSPNTPFQPFPGIQGAPDLETALQISKIIQALNSNQNNPKTAFLSSLKPFLKEHRQKSLDKAATLLKVASAFKALKKNDPGGV